MRLLTRQTKRENWVGEPSHLSPAGRVSTGLLWASAPSVVLGCLPVNL